MAAIDRVKWEAPKEVYARKHPAEDLATWTQLIVSETQEAVLLKEGRMLGPFGPGRHTLDTKNIPVLDKFLKIPFGKKTPFTAEVWFVNKTMQLDVKWGTQSPVQVKDPVYGVMIPMRFRGQFGIGIDQTKRFLKTLVGTLPSFREGDVRDYFRGIVLTKAKDHLATQLVSEGISLLEIAAHLSELSDSLENALKKEFAEFGISLRKFRIISIDADENDSAVITLRDALAEKARLDIMGMSYQQERSFDVMWGAATNEGGGSGGAIGAGIGMGMGMGMGVPMGNTMGNLSKNIDTTNDDSKKKRQSTCEKCGVAVGTDAKFCPSCGDEIHPCPQCGTDNSQDSTVCRKCNTLLPKNCIHCSKPIAADAAFCKHCGKSSMATCSSCGEKVNPSSKFCKHCGSSTDAEKVSDSDE